MKGRDSSDSRHQRTELIHLSREWRIDALYEDRALLAINKPAGLIAAPESWSRTRRNLMLYLQEGIQRHAYWAVSRGIRWIKNAHRLDADTSGVMLLVKNPVSLHLMTDLWEQGGVKKEYIALVDGSPAQDSFIIKRGLAPHRSRVGMMIIDDKHGKASETHVTVEERFPRHTLLRVKPLTGRTHQIRVHLQSLNLPIVADPLYGSGRPAPMKRLGLHALRLMFTHPFTHRPVDISAPMPDDLLRAIDTLRRMKPSNPAGPAPRPSSTI